VDRQGRNRCERPERTELIQRWLATTEFGAQAPSKHEEVVHVARNNSRSEVMGEGVMEVSSVRGRGSTSRTLRVLTHVTTNQETEPVTVTGPSKPALQEGGESKGCTVTTTRRQTEAHQQLSAQILKRRALKEEVEGGFNRSRGTGEQRQVRSRGAKKGKRHRYRRESSTQTHEALARDVIRGKAGHRGQAITQRQHTRSELAVQATAFSVGVGVQVLRHTRCVLQLSN
jgi:hypothetical protein